MEYEKPALSIEEQINLLTNRGLVVNDDRKIKEYLRNISYYHLAIYFKHFQKDDVFIKGTTFEDVLNIYIFDQKLRLLLLDVLERTEQSFKCRFAYEMSLFTADPFWLSNPEYFKDPIMHNEKIISFLENLKYSSKEAYIKHYYETYNFPDYPPMWIIIETLTFRQCVMFYGLLKPKYQEVIANTYGINKVFIYNWLYALSTIRNFCAHHACLWNREIFIKLYQRHGLYKKLFDNSNGSRLFNYLLVLQIINCKFNPASTWVERLEGIITDHGISISYMGFPDNWRDRLQEAKRKSIKDNLSF